jgi:D-alanyl-D-alanine carboxypeptidase
MRFYFAARFSKRFALRQFRQQLEALGHVCTSRWLDAEREDPAALGLCAQEDLIDTITADTLVNFTEVPRGDSRGARHCVGQFSFVHFACRGFPLTAEGGGGYVDRSKRGGGGKSMHAYGTAVDFNPDQNAFQGRTTNFPEETEKIAWKHGLSWGARFGDPMHFEAMGESALNRSWNSFDNLDMGNKLLQRRRRNV